MSVPDRHAVIDPECPHGGPFLPDDSIRHAYRIAERIDRLANSGGGSVRFVFAVEPHHKYGPREIDFRHVGIMRATIARMAQYIGELERELGIVEHDKPILRDEDCGQDDRGGAG